MRISDISIRNPVFAWMLMAALIIFGAIGFSRMGISQLPDADFPVLNISLTYEGAAPEIMETSVVDPIEDVLMSIEGVRSISSNSKTGSASVTIEFELERNIEQALQDVQTKLAQVQRTLPAEVEPPTISKTNPDDSPIMWLALTSEKNDPQYIMKFARDYLKDRFTTVAGVGDIILGGYTEPALRVWVKYDQLQKHNISVNDIMEAIRTEHSEIPGGYIPTPLKNINVRTMGEAKTIEEFENIIINRRAGQLIADPSNILRISQVARIEEGLNDVTALSRFNGKPALGLGIRKQKGSNAVAVARAVKERITEVNKQLPEGMKVNVNFDSTRFIEDSVHEMNKHLLLAVLLTSLVCWAFLGSWTATFNVLLSIPTSIMGAFIGLYFLGFTLNTFTLLGLTLAIGIVVDDAIMVLENIFRYGEKGRNQVEAAIIGAREITFAALAASVAVIAIFLPVAFMKGVIGKFFLQFGVTISLAVFLSLIESLTITPMRCATFVHHGERTTALGKAFERMMSGTTALYRRILIYALSHRIKIVLISLVAVGLSFFSVKFLNKELTPQQDQGLFFVRVTMPTGSSLAYTDEHMKKAEEWLRSRPEVLQVYAAVGGFGGGASNASTGMMFVTMHEKSKRPKDPETGRVISQAEFMNIARKNLNGIKDMKAIIQDLSARGFSSGRGFPIEFTLMGPDWDKLGALATKIMKEMESSGLMTDVDSNYLLGMPEFNITPDRIQAAYHGVSVSAIGNTVNALIGGVRVGKYTKDGHRYDIRLQIEPRPNLDKEIGNLLVGNNRSNLIPLSRVVKIRDQSSLQSISRNNRQRAITIYANLKTGASQQAALEYVNTVAKANLEDGYMIEQGGASKSMQESFQSLAFALVLGFIVAYMILASQFNSFLDPITILMALPFSFTGAFLALALTGQSLNMYSMIGLLLLMGIVKKNSILMIEFTNTIRDRGVQDPNQALIEACPIRLRPILMTSFATMAGALPSAIAWGAGGETTRPMAIALIGGVLVSTFLTLLVVPCVYSLLDRIRKRDAMRDSVKKAFASVGNEALET